MARRKKFDPSKYKPCPMCGEIHLLDDVQANCKGKQQ